MEKPTDSLHKLIWVTAVATSLGLTSASAAPLVNAVNFNTDRYGPNSVPGFTGVIGNRLGWGVNVTTTGTCGGVTGTFSRGASGPFSLLLIAK